MATAGTNPGSTDFLVRRGDDWAAYRLEVTLFDYDPIDTSEWEVVAQFRRQTDDVDEEGEFLIAKSRSNTEVLVLDFSLTDTVTAAMSGTYVWDVQATYPDGKVSTWRQGTIKVSKDVTR
jgi:hypothetical protein